MDRQARFTKITDADGVHIITRDETTELEWQAGFFDERYTHEEAEKVARKCRIGGHKDWRVPGPHETSTTVDYSRCNPAINTEFFPGTPSEAFLASGVPCAFNPSVYVWVQYFHNGGSDVHSRSIRFRLRLVRGPVRQ